MELIGEQKLRPLVSSFYVRSCPVRSGLVLTAWIQAPCHFGATNTKAARRQNLAFSSLWSLFYTYGREHFSEDLLRDLHRNYVVRIEMGRKMFYLHERSTTYQERAASTEGSGFPGSSDPPAHFSYSAA